ncbi:MAG: DJ-1/PfpI family protein [Candidatus Diapherotrites archaeon]|nr:DJ-1/PfpI family protein [Candidatus Diapherotrites archaeon]
MPKVLMVVARDGFRDEELFKTREELEAAGHEVVVASDAVGLCKGKLGGSVRAELALCDAKEKDFDALVFVGGPGAAGFFDDDVAHGLAKDFFRAEKPVAAICIAPCILARAGLLRGRNATVWSGPEYVRILKEEGAKYTGKDVEVASNMITASGPHAARDFGKAVAKRLG